MADPRTELRHSLEIRYAGQDFSMPVPADADLFARGDRVAVKNAFNTIHQQAFGYHDADQPLEIVNVRLAAVARRTVAPGFSLGEPRGRQPSDRLATRPVWFEADAPIDCPVHRREHLPAGARLTGPAIVEEYASTTLVGPGDRLEVTPTGELVVTLSPTRPW